MRGENTIKLLIYSSIFLFIIQLSSALVITPNQLSLDNFDEPQEFIITFLNDGFEPLGLEPRLLYESQYMNEYVSFEPEKFLLKPGEQENVILKTQFPHDFPPQEHKLIVEAFSQSIERLVLTFHPSGTPIVSLNLEEFTSIEEENGKAITLSVNLKNSGNTVLFVTPRIFIKKQGKIIKNTTYPQPLIVLPGNVFPITLRQDNGDLAEGEYVAVIDALYKADGTSRITKEEVTVFTVLQEKKNTKKEPKNNTIFILGGIVFTGILLFIWLKPLKNKSKKKSNVLISKEKKYYQAWEELRKTQKEFRELYDESIQFQREAQVWLQKRGL